MFNFLRKKLDLIVIFIIIILIYLVSKPENFGSGSHHHHKNKDKDKEECQNIESSIPVACPELESCTNFTVNIPDGVTEIADSAFYNCKS